MRCNSANMLRQAARCIDRKHGGTYRFMLEQMAEHIEQVRDGTAMLDEFADLRRQMNRIADISRLAA